MPNTRITNLTEDTTPADDDFVASVDVSDTTQSAQGTTKKVQAQNLVVKKLRTSTGPAVLTVGAVADGEFLKRSGTSIISGAPGGGGLGDVAGPSSATDNALARFDSTTGKLIQDSPVTVSDAGAITVPEIAAPSTPAAGKVAIYAKADNKVYRKGEDGVEAELGGGSGTTINASDARIPYRSNATTFVDSLLAHDATNGQTTSITGHIMLSQNNGKIFGWGNSTIAFGGFQASGVGCVRVVADAAGNPGTILSNFAAAPLPGGNPTPWSSAGMNFEHTLTSSGQTVNNPGNHGGDGVAPSGYRFVIFLIQDGTGSRTVNWGTDMKFPGGTLPTLTTAANAIDVFEFICRSDIAYCIGQFLDVK